MNEALLLSTDSAQIISKQLLPYRSSGSVMKLARKKQTNKHSKKFNPRWIQHGNDSVRPYCKSDHGHTEKHLHTSW